MRQRMVHYVVVIFDNWVYYLLNVQLEDSILFRTNGNTGTSENDLNFSSSGDGDDDGGVLYANINTPVTTVTNENSLSMLKHISLPPV